MNVSLTPELEQMVHEKVETGMYNSASEVIRDALRLYKDFDEVRQKRIEELRREIQIGLDELDRGEGILIRNEEEHKAFFERIKREGRERLAARRRAK